MGENMARAYVTDAAGGAILNVRAAPRSSRPGIDGVAGDAIKVRVKAAPVDGKANKEILETVADALGVPKSAVSFKSGETSKTKRLFVAGVAASRIVEAVEK